MGRSCVSGGRKHRRNIRDFGGLAKLLLGVAVALFLVACGREDDPEPAPAQQAQPITSGPCNFAAPPSPGTPSNRTFTIKVPSGTTREEFALSTAGGVLTISDGVIVSNDAGGYASVSNVEATNRLWLGSGAKALNALSELTGIELRPQTHLYGYAKTASTIIQPTGALIDGAKTQNASLRPLATTSWIVPFPANTRGNCILQPDQTQTIDPGTYGTLTINARSHLKLRSGTYYFRGLSLEADALLDVDNAAGPVYVYVRDTFAFNGKVVPASLTQSNVLFGYAGTAQFNVLSSFWGILSAPNATVSLAPTGTTGHTGSFFAKTLTAQAGSTIHHRPFGPATFCAGSTACSVLCPCGPGGSCQSNSDCQAGLSCTAGTCQPTSIDDGNPCTADSIDGSGNVIHTPVPAGTSCADSNLCNGQEVCNATAQCLPGSPPNLDDGNACTTDACTPSGGITHTPVAAGTSCSNGNACDGDETCTAEGTCAGSPPPALDDQNPCTADTCTEQGGIAHTPLPGGTSCADANVCNGAEVCNSTGTCTAGTPPVLDDSNACTADSCDPNTGIHHDPVPDGTSCADADLCNGPEACDGSGTCVAGAPSEVDDSNPCTVDACDPVTGVSHEPVAEGTSCDDGDLCNGTSTCDAAGSCVVGMPPVIDDANPCTVDACSPATGVTHAPVPAGTSCTDDNACNGAESCNAGGACMPGTAPALDDQNPCTTDTCDPATGVAHTPVVAGTSCADGNACNGAELCDSSGECSPGTPPPTDDGNPCTADACDPASGVSHTPVAAGTSCADSNFCNGAEACDSGGTCASGSPLETDDGNPCTADSCVPAEGVQHIPVSAGTSCVDATVCNGAETCDGIGACSPGTPLTTDDANPCTADACDPVTGVNHAPVATGTSCSDADLCNGAEVCNASGSCTAGTPLIVDDANPCTADACDPVAGVSHAPLAAGTACSDADPCNGTESCNASGQCASTGVSEVDDFNPCTVDTCDATNGIQHTPVAAGISCADDNVCNGEERCDAVGQCAAGGPLDIDDNDSCTLDECDPAGGPMHTEIPGCRGATPGDQFETRASIMGHVMRVDGSAVNAFTVSVFNDTLDTQPRTDTDTAINPDGTFRVRLLTFPESVPDRTPAQHVLIKLVSADFPDVYREAYVRPGDVVSLGDIVVLQRDPNVTVIGPEGGTAEDSQGTLQLVVPAGALTEPTPIRLTPIRTRAEFPLPLPHNVATTYGMEIEPSGTTLALPATLRIRNTLNIPTSMKIPVGTLDPRFADWKTEGQATWDGERFVVQIEHFSPHDANLGLVGELVTFIDDSHDPNKAKDSACGVGSSASYTNGSLQQSFQLPMHAASGHDYGLSLNYDSGQSGSVAFGTPAANAIPTSGTLTGIVRSPAGTGVRVECLPAGSAAASGCSGGATPCRIGGQIAPDFEVLQRSRLFDQDASARTDLEAGTSKFQFDFNYLLPNDPSGVPVRSGYFPSTVTSSLMLSGGATSCVVGGAGFGVAAPAPNAGGGQAPGGSARLPLEPGAVLEFPDYQLVVHRRGSPLGSGWAFADFGTLYRAPNGMSADVMWGNGQRETFRPYPRASRVVNMGNTQGGALAVDRQTGEIFTAWAFASIQSLDPATGDRTNVAPNPGSSFPQNNLAITYVNGERVFLIETPNRLYESRTDGTSRQLLTLVTGPAGLRPGLAAVGRFAYVTSDRLSSGADAQVIRRVDLADPERAVVTITSAGGGDLSLDPHGEVRAQDFWFIHPRGLAPAFDGGLYVSDDRRHAVYHLAPDENGEVGPNSLVTRVLGSGLDTMTVGLGRKLPALQMPLRAPEMLSTSADGIVYVTSATVGGVMAFDPLEKSARWLAFDRNSALRNVEVNLQFSSLAPLGSDRILTATNDSIYRVEAPFTSEFEPTRSISFSQTGATLLDTTADTVQQYEWITPAKNEARLIAETLRSGEPIRSITYQDADRIDYIEDPAGGRVQFEYDASGRLHSVTDAADRSTDFDIDPDGNLREIRYPSGETLRFDYEDFRLTRVTHPNSESSTYTYAPDGTLASATRPGGGVTQLQSAMSGGPKYDDSGNLFYEAELTDDRGVEHAIQVNAAGAVISDKFTADGQSYVVENVYAPQLTGESLYEHAANRLLRIAGTTVNGLPVTPLASFNPLGQLIGLKRTTTPTAASVVSPKYDAAQRVSQIDWAINFVRWGYTYDAAGHLIKVADQFTNGTETGRTTTLAGFRAADGQPTSVTQHGITSTLGYDEFGLVSSSVDTAGRSVSITNDAAGNARVVNDGTTTVRFDYDDGSRLASITDAENNVTEFGYTATGCACSNGDRLTSIKTPDLGTGQEWSFDYSPDGDLAEATTPLGETEQLFHNAQRDVIAAVDRKNRSTTFTYDQLGRQSTSTDALGRIGSFAYSAPTATAWSGPTLYAQSATDTPAPTSLSAALADGQFQVGTSAHQPYDSASRAELYRDATFQLAFWSGADLLNRPARVQDRSAFPINSETPGPDTGGPITDVLFTYENNEATEISSSPFPMLQGLASSDAYENVQWSGKLKRNADLDVRSIERVLGRSPSPLFRTVIQSFDITRDTAGRITRVDTIGASGSMGIGYKENGIQIASISLSTPTLTTDTTGQCWCNNHCLSRKCTVNSETCSSSGPAGECEVSATSVDSVTRSFEYDARALPATQTVVIRKGGILQPYPVGDFVYEYDSVGRNTVLTYPGGHVRSQSFDAIGRLTSRCYNYADGSPEHCYTAAYDAAGNPVVLTDPDMRREIDYDDLDRVTEVRRFVPPNATTPTHVETYAYNALGGFSVYDSVVMDDRRPRLDGTGTASAGIPASLDGTPVSLDAGGRVASLSGRSFQYFKTDHRLKAILTPTRNTLFVYDALGRLMQTHSQAPGLAPGAPGAVDELVYYSGTADVIAAEAASSVPYPTPPTEPREPLAEPDTKYKVIYDGIDQPLWIVRGNRTATYELDTTGNVRRLHAGQQFSVAYPDGNDPTYTGDLGGYAYSAFGKRLAPDDIGGLQAPALGFIQPFTWQGKRGLGYLNLYYSRARIWSADLGSFLQPDQYAYLSRGGTLWSWPGQNPFRWRDPSGRFGIDDVNNLLFWLDDQGAFQAYGDYASGLSSALTFGLSDILIDATGLGRYGDKCSTARGIGQLAGLAAGLVAGGEFAAAGREISLGRNFRLAPFGNRTGHSLGRWPHYHRRAIDRATGQTRPGQGIGRHRPIETKSNDTSFWDRF